MTETVEGGRVARGRRPWLDYSGRCQDVWPKARSEFIAPLQGAHHETYTSVPHDGVQEPPTQGHNRDMGTTPNTAAIYVRRSAFDAENTEAGVLMEWIEV